MYLHGEGVDRDYEAAIGWFEKAAALGSTWALHNLGVTYEQDNFAGHSMEKAFRYYSQAAEKGRGYSQYNPGLWHHQGRFVTQDFKKAFELYTLASEKGVAPAFTNLGSLYQYAQGMD